MNIQQHERITRIKKLSRYLYVSLTWVRYLIWALWPLMVIGLFVDTKWKYKFLGNEPIENINYFQRIMIAIFISIFFYLVVKLIYHFRELIRHFAIGDIFNKKAITHARKALLNGLVIYGFSLSSLFAQWIYSSIQNPHVNFSLDMGIIFAFMFFGLMYVLLWSLEIGCDLNEESELTI